MDRFASVSNTHSCEAKPLVPCKTHGFAVAFSLIMSLLGLEKRLTHRTNSSRRIDSQHPTNFRSRAPSQKTRPCSRCFLYFFESRVFLRFGLKDTHTPMASVRWSCSGRRAETVTKARSAKHFLGATRGDAARVNVFERLLVETHVSKDVSVRATGSSS